MGRLMRFVSRSVITGFVNALAILIFSAQLPELIGVPIETYWMIAAALRIIYLFPYVTKSIPSPLVAIVILTMSLSGQVWICARLATWVSFLRHCPYSPCRKCR